MRLPLRRWHVIGLAVASVLLVVAVLYAVPTSPLSKWLLERKMEGKWSRPDDEIVFEFLSDGTVLLGKESAKWSALSRDRIKIVETRLGTEVASTLDDISFSKEQVSLSFTGTMVTLQRKD